MKKERVVIKIGTSTLAYENGKLNIRRVEMLSKIISDIQNSGKEIIIVTSGSIGVGAGKLGIVNRPAETRKKQALAAVGQCELMFIYDKLFRQYNHTVAQVLLTRRVIIDEKLKENVINTLNTLLEMDIIPIVNENDTVAIDELVGQNFGDNDTLSAIVAKIIDANRLVILTDIDGLYDSDPRIHKEAKLISRVELIDDSIKKMAGNKGSRHGTGGMATKILAAVFANEAGIDCHVINGQHPNNLYDLFDGKKIGTLFKSNKKEGK